MTLEPVDAEELRGDMMEIMAGKPVDDLILEKDYSCYEIDFTE